ncbi:hypothetical protein F4821DRAFT_245095 [Hypoxylon rubiginosum]|uniref:Uncharacterized protein n=1 Tax=Hypoxylon rubiginosum TaxID=110542 RepID=A0ACC0CS51_9PEZI|nr:hypothetical protein F4821DRAFT_245095 [Hypoxylon rubiginosum]
MSSTTGDSSSSASNRITITESHLNPMLQIVTYLLLAFTTLVLSFRLFTNILVKGRMPVSLEDLLFLSAFLFAVAESVTMVIPASNILGNDINQITTDELVGGLKAQYARDILFILSLSMAKLSSCRNIFILSPNDIHRLFARIIAWIIGLWMVVCIFATAFQCGIKGPWMQEDNHCIDQHAFLTFMCVMSIITDAALVALPLMVIYPLNMVLGERLGVMLFYCTRALIIPATICQIVYIPRLPDPNYTLHVFPYSICVQVVQFLSFLAVCVVYFWPFIRSLQGGLERSSDTNMISQYVLSKQSRPSRSKVASLSIPPSNQMGDRSNYIELRATDSAGSKRDRPRASNTGSNRGIV